MVKTRLEHLRVKILNFSDTPDSMGDVFDSAGVTVREGEVPVAYDYSDDITKFMGWATLEKTDDGVYANIKSKDEERLKPLYPGAGGMILDRQGGTIKKCEIRMVGVHMGRNTDYSIGRIGEQLEKK
jgi:hypothetical protein